MNQKHKTLLPALALVILFVMQISTLSAQPSGGGQPPRQELPPIPITSDTTHTLSKHFAPAGSAKKTPNTNGFIQRWLVLQPLKKDIARNNILTDSFLRRTLAADNFSNDYTIIPKKDE